MITVGHLKLSLVLFIGLHALFYALQIANFDAAHVTLVYVLSGTEHELFSAAFFFVLRDPAFAFAAALVLVGGFAVAYFGIKGHWELFIARAVSVEKLHEAKRNGVILASFALLVWFGFFMSFGVAFFRKWQTQVGTGSMEGAFLNAVASAIILLFVSPTED